MPRIENLPEDMGASLSAIPIPEIDGNPWATGPPVRERRVAIVTTAGLHHRGDRPFTPASSDYRVLRGDSTNEFVSSHFSPNVDRAGFAEDLNVVFPLDRLRELAAAGDIGSVADVHYSFMGATNVAGLEPAARELATHLRADDVRAVLLVPV